VATGFHLNEYTVGELCRLFRKVGFRKVQALIGRRGVFLPTAVAPVIAAERALELLPAGPRQLLARTVGRAFLGVRLVGTK